MQNKYRKTNKKKYLEKQEFKFKEFDRENVKNIENRKKELLNLIRAKKTLSELKQNGYCDKDVSRIIVPKGKIIVKNSDIDGNILYKEVRKTNKSFIDLQDNDYIKFLVVADFHIGHSLTNVEFLDDVYNYALKNNIHHVLMLGDLIQGPNMGLGEISYNPAFNSTSPKKQMDFVLRNYPKINNIVTFAVYGNHDILRDGRIDSVIERERDDFINLGYYDSKNIMVGDKTIKLCHPDCTVIKESVDLADIHLKGHSHVFSVDSVYPRLNVKINAMSGLRTKTLNEAGFAELEIELNDGMWEYVTVRDMMISKDSTSISGKKIKEKALVRKNY